MKQTDVFLLSKNIPVETTGEGVSRQILGYDANIMLVKVNFEKGSIGSMHSHPHVQTSYIESGKFEMTIDGKKQILEKGDGFFVPSGIEHGLVCLEVGAVLDCFNPVREDFL